MKPPIKLKSVTLLSFLGLISYGHHHHHHYHHLLADAANEFEESSLKLDPSPKSSASGLTGLTGSRLLTSFQSHFDTKK